MAERWVSQVFRDAADRVARDPYMPTSSMAWNGTRRATIRPVRAVRTPVVYPATPPTGAGNVDVVGVHTFAPVDSVYLAHLQRLTRHENKLAGMFTRSAASWRRERLMPS